MTPAQQQAMQAGRARALAERCERQADRVDAYRAWLRNGMPAGEMPELPTDGDFRAHRRLRGEQR